METNEVETLNMTQDNIPKVKPNKKSHFPIIIVVVIALIAIFVGLYINYIGNPKRVIASAIDKVSNNIKSYVDIKNKNDVGDNFTLTSNLKMNVQSDYLTALGTMSDTYKPYINLLNNLSKMDNNIKFVQNKKEKKLFASIDSKLNTTKLINAKYLIQNNTEYYFINNFLTTYINNGNNDYFEALDSNTTSTENMEYIYDFSIKSFKKNLKNEYFTTKSATQEIDGKEVKVNKITLTITNDNLIELATNILNDLKQNKKANKILTGIDKDFSNSKVKQSTKILKDNEKLEFNVYADLITYQAKLYELNYIKDENSSKITYEISKNKSYINVLSDNKTLCVIEYETNNNKKTISIKDSNKKQIATIETVSSDTSLETKINATIETITIDASIESITKEVKKNENYTNSSTLKLKITTDNTVLGNLELAVLSKLTNDATIKEDVSTSVLSSSVTDKQKEQLQTNLSTILVGLMS